MIQGNKKSLHCSSCLHKACAHHSSLFLFRRKAAPSHRTVAEARLAGTWGEREECAVCVSVCVFQKVRKEWKAYSETVQSHNAPLNPQRTVRVGQKWPGRLNETVRGGVWGRRPITLWASFAELAFCQHRETMARDLMSVQAEKERAQIYTHHTLALSHTSTCQTTLLFHCAPPQTDWNSNRMPHLFAGMSPFYWSVEISKMSQKIKAVTINFSVFVYSGGTCGQRLYEYHCYRCTPTHQELWWAFKSIVNSS